MGFDRDRYGGRSGGGFRGRSSGGFSRDRDRRPAEMHDAVCDKCKKPCQVPFRPTAGKPVLCSDCFKESGGSSRGRESSSGISPEQFSQLSTKLDRILKILGSAESDIVEIKAEVKEAKKEDKAEIEA